MRWFPVGAAAAIAAMIPLMLVSSSPGAQTSRATSLRPGGPLAPHRSGEVLLKFRPEADAAARARILARLGGVRRHAFIGGAEHRQLKTGLTTEQALEDLAGDEALEYIEPNYVRRATVLPNDPRVAELWGLHRIQAPAAWEISTGTRDVLVGVIDTGIRYDHPDLVANIWTNPGEIPGNGIDDEGNGYVDDVHGWDFVNNDNDPSAFLFHGTHVAGTIGAVGNNGVGVTGVNWRVSLAAIKFLDDSGSGYVADALKAFDYAIRIRARITNNSWGGFGYSRAEEEALRRTESANQLVVVAAGNSSLDIDYFREFPASVRLPNIITVAATNNFDELASFSNFGLTTVDIGAPGVNILSTSLTNPQLTPGYGTASGTSMAAPHVAGAAALLLSVAPDLTAPLLRQRLMLSAEALPSLQGRTVTGGRLNLVRALTARDTVAPGAVGGFVAAGLTSNSVNLSWTATGDDADTGLGSAYDLRYSTTPIEDDVAFEAAPRVKVLIVPAIPGLLEQVEVTGLQPATSYHFGLVARDEWGNGGPLQSASASTLPPPAVEVSPASFTAGVASGSEVGVTLSIRNAGEGTLDWAIPRQTPLPPLREEPPVARPGSAGNGLSILRYGEPPLADGYRFIDSSEPEGPRFRWDDIFLEALVPLTGDEELSEPLPLGFSFPFFGESFDSVRICSNGYLTFTGDFCYYGNEQLPSPFGAPNMIAPWWHDIDLGETYRVSVTRGDGRFTVQFTDAPRYFYPMDTITFQATLFASGDILFQYLDIGSFNSWGTIGIQDETGARALQVAHNEVYLHDGLAVRITRRPSLVTPDVESGRLRAGEAHDVNVRLDAAQLTGGRYLAQIPLYTNDPQHPVVNIPITLDVLGESHIQVNPESLDFGTMLVGSTRRLPLTLDNPGHAAILVDLIPEEGLPITVVPSSLVVEALSRQVVDVRYAPDRAGSLAGGIELTINEGGSLPRRATLSGRAFEPPRMQVDVASIDETLKLGGLIQRNVRVSNVGAGDLHLTVGRGESVLPVVPGVFANGGFESGALSGWTAASNGLGQVLPWTVALAGGGRLRNADPSEGLRDLASGFDGEDGLETTLFQSFFLPDIAGPLRLVFQDRIQYTSQGLSSTRPRIYEATLLNLLNQPLAQILREEILLDGAPYTDLGWRERSFDLTPYKGRRLGIRIRQSIPEGLRGAASLELDGFRVEAGERPDWMRVEPAGATLPPGGWLDVTVTLDARKLAPGAYLDEVRLEGLPGEGALALPIGLTVEDAPDLEVSRPVTLRSSKSYTGYGAATSHRLAASIPPTGGGIVELTATGVFGTSSQTATLVAEGRTLGQVGGTATNCVSVHGAYPLEPAELTALMADGFIDLDVRNASEVADYCSENRHDVSLTYPASIEVIEFGRIALGESAQHTLRLRNNGTEPLLADFQQGASTQFAVTPDRLTLAPGQEESVAIGFAPTAQGSASSSLELSSNDPDHPSLRIDLRGQAFRPPAAVLAPERLRVALPPGAATAARTLRLANTGGADLSWSVSGALPAWLAVDPVEGSIPAGGAATISVRLSPAGIADGDHEAAIALETNDPALDHLEVPVALHVGYVPLDRLTIVPSVLNATTKGQTVLVFAQLPAAYDPHLVILSSVSLQGTVFARPAPVRFADTNRDGVLEIVIAIDRRELTAAIPARGDVRLELTGEVRDVTWFRGETTIRVMHSTSAARRGASPRRSP